MIFSSDFIPVLLVLFAFEQSIQGIEAEIPSGGVVRDPHLGFFQARGLGANQMQSSVASAPDQSGSLQHAKVSGEGRQRHPEWLCEGSYAAFSSPGKLLDDAAPGRVREGRESDANPLLFVNHNAKYNDASAPVKDDS